MVVGCFSSRHAASGGTTRAKQELAASLLDRKSSPRRAGARSEAEKRELQLWMKQKRSKQMREYLQQVEAKREREAHPFGSNPVAATHKPVSVLITLSTFIRMYMCTCASTWCLCYL